MKIAIVTDGIANITEADLNSYPIYMGYMNVIVNDKTYVDTIELNAHELFKMIDEGATYSTSQPSPDVFVQLYEKLLNEYDHILSIHCSHKMSGTVNSARIASTMVEGGEERITIIDSKTAAPGEENIIIRVGQLINEGKSLDYILKVIAYYIDNNALCITIDDLNTLVRSGRLSKGSAMIGNLLNIKPVIAFDEEGSLQVIEKVRTKKRVIKYICERINTEIEKTGKQIIRIAHIDPNGIAIEVKQAIEENCKNVEVYIGDVIGPAMAVQFGRGGFAVHWLPAQYKI
ncbi:MAG: DegV family protein [Turicibacter sp.]